MIGGRDVIIPCRDPLVALEFSIRAIRRLWPSAVLEDGETGDVLEAHPDVGLGGRHEVLAFKDSAASKLWCDIGASESTAGTLIHLIATPGLLTLVVDDHPTPDLARFVRSLSRSLKQDLFAGQALREAV